MQKVGVPRVNPIELVWSQMKREVARKNASNIDMSVPVLISHVKEALSNVTQQQWHNYVGDILKKEKEAWLQFEIDIESDSDATEIYDSLDTDIDSDATEYASELHHCFLEVDNLINKE